MSLYVCTEVRRKYVSVSAFFQALSSIVQNFCHIVNDMTMCEFVTVYYSSKMSRVMRQLDAKTKAQISFAVTAKLISAFVFATPLLLKSEIPCFYPASVTVRFSSDVVGNPEGGFTRVATQNHCSLNSPS